MMTLYLTAFEQKLLRSDMLKDWKWGLEEEFIGEFESTEELDARMKLISSGKFPEMQKLAAKISATMERGETLDSLLPDDFTDSAFLLLLFGIGTLGMSGLIEVLLQNAKSFDDLEGIAALSEARHILLQANKNAVAK